MYKLFCYSIVLIHFINSANSQGYVQNFENVSLSQLVNDSGWTASGVSIGNSNKLSGNKELVTQILNTSTSSNTYITTPYFRGKGTNIIQFDHVINNASGKNIYFKIYAFDTTNAIIDSFIFTYLNASVNTSTWSFTYNNLFSLRFEWSGAKVKSGSTASLDMIISNRSIVPYTFTPSPVRLIDFKASSTFDNCELKWTTADENNLNKFDVLRSFDGKNYLSIGTVNASGKLAEMTEYTFTDFNVVGLNKAVIFYRLKLIDNDEQFALSNIAALNVNMLMNKTAISIAPNPATDILNVILKVVPETDINAIILDANGKIVRQILNTEISSPIIRFDIKELEAGIYFIKILNEDGSITSGKFIKE